MTTEHSRDFAMPKRPPGAWRLAFDAFMELTPKHGGVFTVLSGTASVLVTTRKRRSFGDAEAVLQKGEARVVPPGAVVLVHALRSDLFFDWHSFAESKRSLLTANALLQKMARWLRRYRPQPEHRADLQLREPRSTTSR